VSLSLEAREALLQHDWPGNVREFQNLLERAVVLSGGGVIGPDDLARAQDGDDRVLPEELLQPPHVSRPLDHGASILP
jgi:DNA-binding NtrC family response regulator